MIKLFACDLDGTLLNQKHETDEFILNTIEEVRKQNRYFTIATGRDLKGAKRNNNFSNIYYICMNGAYIANRQEEVIYSKGINLKVLKLLLKSFPDIHFECINQNHVYIRASKDEYIKHFKEMSIWSSIEMNEKMLENFMEPMVFGLSDDEIIEKGILKINCRINNIAEQKALNDFINEHNDVICNAPFDSGAYELTDASVNKGNAIKFLADYLNINYDEVNVYGDGGNDIEMLSMFKHSYAPSNACEMAKKTASQIIGDNKDYSVSKHILKTLRIKNIIFDFNGTLINDSYLHDLAWQKVAKEKFNLELDLPTIYKYFHGNPNNEAIELIKPNTYSLAEKEAISKYKENIYREMSVEQNLTLKDGTTDLFNYLKQNNYNFNLCSASILENIEFFFEHYHLANWFKFKETVYDNGNYQDKEKMFIDSTLILNSEIENTLILEDSKSGIDSAIKAGFNKIILIYNGDSYNQIFNEYPEIIFKANNFKDVLDYISKFDQY